LALPRACCSLLDATDARKVAALLSIPLYILNFQADFSRVIDYFVSEYNLGRTPNPCIRCNDWLKFGKLAQYAQAVGAGYIATGHYARIGPDPLTGLPTILRAVDRRKDQSYVLFGIQPSVVARTLLPIGHYHKDDVRAIARRLHLPVHSKPDSQEICFVPDQDYAALLRRLTPGAFHPGQFVDTAGQVLGSHAGHQHFTIGQRKGLRLALGRPAYVVSIDPASNRVTIGDKDDLLGTTLHASQANWLRAPPPAPGATFTCEAKIRYNHRPHSASAAVISPDRFLLRFHQPQSAITPGQAVVLYDGDVLLGGGWIESSP
jgi:tRNA-specific 2-thiouridylase